MENNYGILAMVVKKESGIGHFQPRNSEKRICRYVEQTGSGKGRMYVLGMPHLFALSGAMQQESLKETYPEQTAKTEKLNALLASEETLEQISGGGLFGADFGAIIGVLSGTALGGVIGTFICPGPGTVLGARIDAGAGTVLGALIGGFVGDDQSIRKIQSNHRGRCAYHPEL